MNNSTMGLIHRHASVRRYRTDPVPDDMVSAIVAAACPQSAAAALKQRILSVEPEEIVCKRKSTITAS